MDGDLIIGLFIVLAAFYSIYKYFFAGNSIFEGLENKDSDVTATTSTNGVAGSAQNYAAGVQTMATKIQDRLLISKYRSDYESVVLAYDNLIGSLMLETLVTTNTSNPTENLKKLADLQNAKMALNSVLKYIDSQ